MVFFYDPKDDADLTRVEGVLHKGGIEYFLRREPAGGPGRLQVCVAEEDVPEAHRLVETSESPGRP
ncbi:hypothetical protein [Geobacter sp. DSM 9736]|uniref:hypothetical protein n=1 Tax=Geobacter sp. DSM 9736 TaxID=1277350 RepID=UPI000B5017CD|nr:hypothetical protein [Geobacter sp. DSM 9736]SNB47868.1 hypothetical protein SAMN06269301_3362 [Geobacter sp. DSM 9736]